MSGTINDIKYTGALTEMFLSKQSQPEVKKPLWQQVKELEEIQQRCPSELTEARATMIVNFGPDGSTEKGLIYPEMSLTAMIVRVFEHYIKK